MLREPAPKVTLRLFHQTDPFRQVEARELAAGEIVVGRDEQADWTIPDPDRALSRRHCVLAAHDGRLTVRDLSSNGVFIGARRQRPPADEPYPVENGETLRLGDFLIVVETGGVQDDSAFDAPFNRPILQPVAVAETALAIPTDWAGDAPAAKVPPSDGSLLEAFCAGARLDASSFSGEDPAEVMRRLGAVYQQMVLGLGDLMGERTTVKNEYRMTRTTIRAEGNNPFRWAPAHRVAVDLLRAREDGFLTGPSAVKASFEDLKKHLLCLLAGLRAALGSAIDELAPETVEELIKDQSFVLKNRGATAWSEYQRLHAAFREQADDDPDSPVNRAFRNAYERQLEELDALSTRA